MTPTDPYPHDQAQAPAQPHAQLHAQSHAQAHPDEPRGAYPTGTVAVVGFLVIMIGAFWLLVLGVLQGRA